MIVVLFAWDKPSLCQTYLTLIHRQVLLVGNDFLYIWDLKVNNSVLKTQSVSRTANLPPELVVLG